MSNARTDPAETPAATSGCVIRQSVIRKLILKYYPIISLYANNATKYKRLANNI